MAAEEQRRRRLRGRPARPLYGYRDIGPAARHTRAAEIRAWAILALLIVLYLAVVLTIYFVEPGLR